MGECGCVSNDDVYTLPGPKGSLYVIRLSGPCQYCESPPGVTVERFDRGTVYYDHYTNPDEGGRTAKPLPLEAWPDGPGVAIVTGMTRRELERAGGPHLIGVSSRPEDLGDDGGRLGEVAAEVLMEQMYDDVTFKPRLAGEGGR